MASADYNRYSDPPEHYYHVDRSTYSDHDDHSDHSACSDHDDRSESSIASDPDRHLYNLLITSFIGIVLILVLYVTILAFTDAYEDKGICEFLAVLVACLLLALCIAPRYCGSINIANRTCLGVIWICLADNIFGIHAPVSLCLLVCAGAMVVVEFARWREYLEPISGRCCFCDHKKVDCAGLWGSDDHDAALAAFVQDSQAARDTRQASSGLLRLSITCTLAMVALKIHTLTAQAYDTPETFLTIAIVGVGLSGLLLTPLLRPLRC